MVFGVLLFIGVLLGVMDRLGICWFRGMLVGLLVEGELVRIMIFFFFKVFLNLLLEEFEEILLFDRSFFLLFGLLFLFFGWILEFCKLIIL